MDDPHDNRSHDGVADGEPRPTAPRRMAGRGGGPPGGSAFGRRAERAQPAERAEAAQPVRRIRATPAPHLVFESLDSADDLADGAHQDTGGGSFDPVESLFDPSWIGTAAGSWGSEDSAPDSEVGGRSDDRLATDRDVSPSDHSRRADLRSEGGKGERRMFPGGHVRLPPLGAAEDNLHFVGTAFVRRNEERTTADRSAFDEYFTFESLFEEPTEESTKDGPLNPYGVLGVEPGSPWRDVVAAHRKLVKLHHPDRLVDADPATIGAAEERLRQINWAYGELGRSRQQ